MKYLFYDKKVEGHVILYLLKVFKSDIHLFAIDMQMLSPNPNLVCHLAMPHTWSQFVGSISIKDSFPLEAMLTMMNLKHDLNV